MDELISQLHIMEYINIYLILFLLGIGFIIKHTKRLEDIPNDYIPIILYCISLVYEIASISSYEKVSIINSIIDGTIAAAIAIGLHTSGKQLLFKSDTISNILKINNKDNNDKEDITDDE